MGRLGIGRHSLLLRLGGMKLMKVVYVGSTFPTEAADQGKELYSVPNDLNFYSRTLIIETGN